MWAKTYLRWFRDFGRGQEASTYYGAIETQDGLWPIASLPFTTEEEQNRLWRELLDTFGVNATATYED